MRHFMGGLVACALAGLFLMAFGVAAYAGKDRHQVNACPNGVFADGMMYDSANNYTNNRCANDGATCQGTYFYAAKQYMDAQCRGGSWMPAGSGPIPVEPDGGIGDGAGPIPVGPGNGNGNSNGNANGNVNNACPSGVFDDGYMYNAANRYVPNACRNSGKICKGTYFYAENEYRKAVCNNGVWADATAMPEPMAFCGGIAGIPCPTGYTCVDNPQDSCDPLNGGADCSGFCKVNDTPDVQCNFETDLHEKQYVGRSPEECSRILFLCDEGFEPFGDACGCGCIRSQKGY